MSPAHPENVLVGSELEARACKQLVAVGQHFDASAIASADCPFDGIFGATRPFSLK
jgi:hypothetical protein